METKKITVEIDNLTDSQVIALEDMFATWASLGHMGSSRWTSFYADGDGNFRPKITIDGRKPEITTLMKSEDKWQTLQKLVEPTKNNGLKEPEWRTLYEVYMMDFDTIAWKLNDNQQ